MSRQLLNSWAQFQAAVDCLLELAQHKIQVYDLDLGRFKFESPPRLECLKQLTQGREPDRLRLALQETATLQQNSPRFLRVYTAYPASISVLKTAGHLSHLQDAMILVDGCHGLVFLAVNSPDPSYLSTKRKNRCPICSASRTYGPRAGRRWAQPHWVYSDAIAASCGTAQFWSIYGILI